MGNLKICLLRNGLANQVFQYVFSRYIELKSADIVFFDDSCFWRENIHNGYQLENVFPNIKTPKLLSRLFSESAWRDIIKKCDEKLIHEQLNDLGIDMLFVIEGHLQDFMKGGRNDDVNMDWIINKYSGDFVPSFCYNPGLAKINRNIYFYGYWCINEYFNEIKQQMLEELVFPPIKGDNNIRYADKIINANSVAIHIRRGDFVELGWDENSHYYARSIRAIFEKISEPKFFIFSDDQEWCKANVSEFGLSRSGVTFIESNVKEDSYIDLQLMSMCNAIVATPLSTFSKLAALLNKNKNVIVLR